MAHGLDGFERIFSDFFSDFIAHGLGGFRRIFSDFSIQFTIKNNNLKKKKSEKIKKNPSNPCAILFSNEVQFFNIVQFDDDGRLFFLTAVLLIFHDKINFFENVRTDFAKMSRERLPTNICRSCNNRFS